MRRRAFLVSAGAVWAQSDAPTPRRHTAGERYLLFKNHLAIRGQAISQNPLQGIGTIQEWERRRPEIRRQLLDMLGLDPLPSRTPLRARVTGELRRDGYRVEKIVFESRPGLYVTGNLYLPAASRKQYPTIVYVSGHAPGPVGAKAQYQHHGIWFAKNGYVAFVLDTLEFAEIPGIHHGVHDLGMWHWLSLGYTPAGVEVWNAIRALDYLETRPEVDRGKVAITGRSGGGAISWYAAAVDERFKVSVPVHGTWSAGPHVTNDVVKENCDCIYYWNTYQIDLPLVGALIAPRPLLAVNARKDESFPPSGYEPVQQCLRPLYKLYGASEAFRTFEEDTGHADLPPYRKAANEWLNRWLRAGSGPFDESGIVRIPNQDLAVLDSYPADAKNEAIHRTFISAHTSKMWKSAAGWSRRRVELSETLRQKVFRAFPKSKLPFETWKSQNRMWTERYAESLDVEFTTEESIRVHGRLFIPRDGKASHPALIYVKGKEDNIFSVDFDNLLSALKSHVVLVIHPRGTDYPMDVPRTSTTKMSIALLGATLESMQLWDILRTIDFLAAQRQLSSISLYGRKDMAALALHTASLDTRVTRVIVEDPPGSHWRGPALLNVLRYTDLPEIAAMAAPREIVSLTPLPQEFDYTRDIFRLLGKPGAIRRADSLGEALKVWEHQ